MRVTTLGTPDLRIAYDAGNLVFSDRTNASDNKTVVLIGSCRIVPYLNYLRVYNSLVAPSEALHLVCLNPVEMWRGPGHEVADGVNEKLANFQFGKVDYLICEHLQYCGVMNTVRSSPENIYDNLGCKPEVEIRLPNWNDMHILDAETAMHDKMVYANMEFIERVPYIREQTAIHKARFLSHCRSSSFPELEPWVEERWLTMRMGWTSSHPSHPLMWRMFELFTGVMGLTLTPELLNHPICTNEVYRSTGIALTAVDYEANNWQYSPI